MKDMLVFILTFYLFIFYFFQTRHTNFIHQVPCTFLYSERFSFQLCKLLSALWNMIECLFGMPLLFGVDRRMDMGWAGFFEARRLGLGLRSLKRNRLI